VGGASTAAWYDILFHIAGRNQEPVVSDEEPATVLVVDDDQSVRSALHDLFESVGLRSKLFGSAKEFLRSKRPDAPCCLVLDVRLPGQSGLDFQRELNEADIRIPIIFLTGHGDIPMSVRAMKAGAVEFLTKPFREQDLLDAVQSALDRDRSSRDEEKLVARLRQRFETLTPREQTVMTLVVAGRVNKQIAGEIGTSEVTAKVHRANMMRKMEAASLADLIAMAGRLGLPSKGGKSSH
jgi:FixJ family two-component response regulator